MKKVYILLFLLTLTFASCKKQESEPLVENIITKPNTTVNEINILQKDFAKILAKAVDKEPALRSFIRTQSLKMFDKDYDVLYQLIKNEKVSEGLSFREI